MTYSPKQIEAKWQKYWEEQGFYQAKDPDSSQKKQKPKYYILIEFPYPSGDGLHVGHCRSYSALDAVARKKRMEGYNVLFPIGWDAFGLPTENYALKTGIHPRIVTEKNTANFRRQLKSLGLSFDWSREINTSDPEYYKWTQWIFIQLFKKGLAYQAEMPINWCPSCKIGLANEEVIDGCCERCGAETQQKQLKQWMLKITEYADRLIDDLKEVDYLEKIKIQQINWIGRSEGAEIKFQIQFGEVEHPKEVRPPDIEVFTTRIDTLFGVTAIVVAPEHEVVENCKLKIENFNEVEKYIEISKKKTELERTQLEKEKTGVPLKGVYAVNPANGEKIPVWVGDYVKAEYGGGAVMVVPAHDKRDFDFAKHYNLPIRQVVAPINADENADLCRLEEAFTDYGQLINSGQFNGLTSQEAIEKITQWLEEKSLAKKVVHYKLRDWVFSRQHYWGEPIPIIHCSKCGAVPIPEEDLPLELPYLEKYQPTGTGESPLAAITEWVNTKCPKCNGPAKRETDTMPNWAGSNWYYLAYALRVKTDKLINWSTDKLKYWMPVDWYNGGFEHTTLHLLYSRFWYKFLYDLGVVPDSEPYKRRTSHGIVLGEDGQKMSKSRGNVVNPDDIVKQYGADTLRLYEMFIGPFDQAVSWSDKGVKGVYRFLEKVWKLQEKIRINPPNPHKSATPLERLLHQTIKKVSEDIEACKFNTIVSSLMTLVNELEKQDKLFIDSYLLLVKLLSPFAPHIAEELWSRTSLVVRRQGSSLSIFQEQWPTYDPEIVKEEEIELIVQVNGKLRDKICVPTDISEREAKEKALALEKIKKWVEGKEIKRVLFVKGKLINIVI